MNTPELWNTIEVDVTQWFLPSVERRLNPLLNAALARSGSVQLNMKIRSAGGFFEQRTLQLLANTSARWARANLHLNSAAFRMLAAVKGNVPCLAQLQVHSDFLHELTTFEIVPQLTALTLRRSGASEPPVLPWDQLCTLEYTDCNQSAYLRSLFFLLRRTPNLTELRLAELDVLALVLPLTLPPVSLGALTSLRIKLDGEEERHAVASTLVLGEIISALTLPCLREFSMCVSGLKLGTSH
jgi:hypothetical protein